MSDVKAWFLQSSARSQLVALLLGEVDIHEPVVSRVDESFDQVPRDSQCVLLVNVGKGHLLRLTKAPPG